MKRVILLCLIPLLFAGCVPKSDLEKANGDLAAANEKINSMASELAGLQLSLTNAITAANTNLAAAETAQEKIKSLELELSGAQTDFIIAQEKMKSLQQDLSDVQKELANAETKPQDPNDPLAEKSIVPVSVFFRKAPGGPGYVAVINTKVKKNFLILAYYTSKALGITKEYPVNLSPIAPIEIGYEQGAAIEDGDVITITSSHYEPLTAVFHPPQN